MNATSHLQNELSDWKLKTEVYILKIDYKHQKSDSFYNTGNVTETFVKI